MGDIPGSYVSLPFFFCFFLWDDFWDASFQICKDYLERDKEGGGFPANFAVAFFVAFVVFGAKAKGAGLVHGENWAAKCEPVEISVARVTLPKTNGWIPKIAIIKGSYLFQDSTLSMLVFGSVSCSIQRDFVLWLLLHLHSAIC